MEKRLNLLLDMGHAYLPWYPIHGTNLRDKFVGPGCRGRRPFPQRDHHVPVLIWERLGGFRGPRERLGYDSQGHGMV